MEKSTSPRLGWPVSREVVCWRKYSELARDLDAEAIEREILQAVADYAGRLLDRR